MATTVFLVVVQVSLTCPRGRGCGCDLRRDYRVAAGGRGCGYHGDGGRGLSGRGG